MSDKKRTQITLAPGQEAQLVVNSEIKLSEDSAQWKNYSALVETLEDAKEGPLDMTVKAGNKPGIGIVEFAALDAQGENVIEHIFEIEVVEATSDDDVSGSARVVEATISAPAEPSAPPAPVEETPPAAPAETATTAPELNSSDMIQIDGQPVPASELPAPAEPDPGVPPMQDDDTSPVPLTPPTPPGGDPFEVEPIGDTQPSVEPAPDSGQPTPVMMGEEFPAPVSVSMGDNPATAAGDASGETIPANEASSEIGESLGAGSPGPVDSDMMVGHQEDAANAPVVSDKVEEPVTVDSGQTVEEAIAEDQTQVIDGDVGEDAVSSSVKDTGASTVQGEHAGEDTAPVLDSADMIHVDGQPVRPEDLPGLEPAEVVPPSDEVVPSEEEPFVDDGSLDETIVGDDTGEGEGDPLMEGDVDPNEGPLVEKPQGGGGF